MGLLTAHVKQISKNMKRSPVTNVTPPVTNRVTPKVSNVKLSNNIDNRFKIIEEQLENVKEAQMTDFKTLMKRINQLEDNNSVVTPRPVTSERPPRPIKTTTEKPDTLENVTGKYTQSNTLHPRMPFSNTKAWGKN